MLVLVGLPASLAAQRGPLAGRVVGADGAPCAGWRVVCVGRPVRIAPELGSLDRVDSSTDERGMFRVRALAGVDYDLWSVGPAGPGGVVGVTDIAHLRGVGSIVELRADRSTRPLVVRVTGTEAWDAQAPFSVVAIPDSFALPMIPATPGDATHVLPALPGEHASIEVRDRRGEVIATGRARLASAAIGDQPFEVRIPAPVELRAVVREADGGAPIGGAVIRWATRMVWAGPRTGTFLQRATLSRWRIVGRAEADGRATLRVPSTDDPSEGPAWQFWLAASADGFADSHSGWQSRTPFVDGSVRDDHGPDGVVQFALHRSRGWSTAIRDSNGPVPDARVVVEATAKIARPGGWTHLPRRFVVRTDAAGRIAIPAMPVDAYRFELAVELPAELREAWRRDAKNAGPLPTYAALITADVEPGEAPPPLSIDGGHTITAQVLDRSGGPAQDARVLVSPLRDDVRTVPDLPLLTRTDVSGRFALRLPDGPHLVVLLHDAGYAVHELAGVAIDGRVDLTLTPYEVLRIDVTDAAGPVAGARVEVVGSTRTYSGPGRPAGQLVDQLFQQVGRRSLERGTSDEHGRIELGFIARRTLGYRLRVTDGRRSAPQIEIDGIPDDDAPIPVELR